MDLRSQKDSELLVKEVDKRCLIKAKNNSLSHLNSLKRGIIEKLKSVKNNDLEDMVFRLKLKITEIADILDTK